jgi:hypothetical protein
LYTSAKETARLRQVCKALDATIRSSTKRLAKQFSRQEMERIQQQVDEFASLKAPTDFDSLMEALHVWTERRGSFEKHEVQQDSAAKLMMHFFLGLGKKYEEEDGNKILQWAATTAYITKLCHDSDSGQTSDWTLDIASKTLAHFGLLAENDYKKLFERVRHPEDQQENHRLDSRLWPSGTREQTTFPKEGRMTPLLQYPSWSEHLLPSDGHDQQTVAFGNFLRRRPSMPLLEATHGNLRLLSYLRLPKLPNEVSCYYLNDNWARKEVKALLAHIDTTAARTRVVGISPLLRAAILARVMLF